MKHTTLFSKILIPFCIAILLVSCATPRAVIRMKPTTDDITWMNGQAIAADTLAGITAKVGFDKAVDDMLVFSFEIINRSNLAYLVDPATIFLEEEHHVNDSIEITPFSIHAIDPETKLLQLDKDLAQSEADAKNARFAGAIMAGAVFATAVALEFNDNPHDDFVDDVLFESTPLLVNEMTHSEADYEVYSLNDKREIWYNNTIRKTTLDPNYSIHGLVFFPRFERPGFYNLKIPVDNDFISIRFMQLNF